MRYFVDVDATQKMIAILAEDGRELVVKDSDRNADEQIEAFRVASKDDNPIVWVFDENESEALLPSLGAGEDVHSILEWAQQVGAPTLPGKSSKQVSGRWVQDMWAFLCRYTGEDMAVEPIEKQEEGTHRIDPEKGIVSPTESNS